MKAINKNAKEGKLHCLELLRFILAFLTMVWHYYFFGPALGVVKLREAAGFAAFRYLSFTVEVFFIISGFIIIASAINRRPVDFIIGRIVRLAPCLLLCATITMAVGVALGVRASVKSYLASIFLVPLVFHTGVDWSYWSLRFEIIFYGLIFFSLCLVDVKRNIYKIALLIVSYDVLSFLISNSLGAGHYLATLIQLPGERYASFFAIGILLYLIIVQKKFNSAIGLTLLAACLMGCIRCRQEANNIALMLSWPRASLLDGCCIFFAVLGIFIFFVRAGGNPYFYAIYSRLGRTSYPLYLLHQNIGYSLLTSFGRRFGIGIDIRPVVMIAMIVLAAVIANLVEPALATQYKNWLSSMRGALRLVYHRALGNWRY